MNFIEWLFGKSKDKVPMTNPLAGKPLRYLIGVDSNGQRFVGAENEIIEVPYGELPAWHGISIGYCNLFDELNTGQYGPYEDTSDTAKQYQEGQIMAGSQGWVRNLDEQFAERKKQGFEYIELDNCDAYKIGDVIGAIERARSYGLKVIAKNPGSLNNSIAYVEHPNIYGIIVEKGAGTAGFMDELRRAAMKPDLPVWFVFFGDGRSDALNAKNAIANSAFRNMGVTYSFTGEYESFEDFLRPHP